jgi:hypothetical protein
MIQFDASSHLLISISILHTLPSRILGTKVVDLVRSNAVGLPFKSAITSRTSSIVSEYGMRVVEIDCGSTHYVCIRHSVGGDSLRIS